MPALREIQRAFAGDLRKETLSRALDLFVDEGISSAGRFDVYRNNFVTSMVDVLAAIYPVTENLVGPEFFAMMANEFVQQYPSRSGNVADFGEALPAFLTYYRAVAKLRYLPDVARLEWSYHSVFHARAPAAFDAQVLQQFSNESLVALRFHLGPASQLVRSIYPIFRIWQINQDGCPETETVNLSDGPESILLFRPWRDVELWLLEPAEAVFLSSIESGLSLGDAVDLSLRHSRTFDLLGVLTRHLSTGTLLLSEHQAVPPRRE